MDGSDSPVEILVLYSTYYRLKRVMGLYWSMVMIPWMLFWFVRRGGKGKKKKRKEDDINNNRCASRRVSITKVTDFFPCHVHARKSKRFSSLDAPLSLFSAYQSPNRNPCGGEFVARRLKEFTPFGCGVSGPCLTRLWLRTSFPNEESPSFKTGGVSL